MSKTTRKIFAFILLVVLIGVPFINWRLGAVLWMCVWLIFIFQNLYPSHNWKLGDDSDQDDEPD